MTNATSGTAPASASAQDEQSLTNGNPLPDTLALFLVQVLLILLVSRAFRLLLRPLKQPAVVAEMLAGILLGPTVLGRVPGFSTTVFPPSSITVLSVVSSFGLCFFMLLVGLELDVAAIIRDLRKTALLSICGLSLPAVGAYLLAILFANDPRYTNTSYGTLGLFLTCAMGISALPVLARILAERNLIATRVGRQCLSLA
jgi:Kef-type K+ transport system membrane component KefB